MTSILKVTEIQDPTNSNTALTIDSSGVVSFESLPTGVMVWRDEQTASGGNQVDFNNIPSGVNIIRWTGWQISQASTSVTGMRIGDSGVLKVPPILGKTVMPVRAGHLCMARLIQALLLGQMTLGQVRQTALAIQAI